MSISSNPAGPGTSTQTGKGPLLSNRQYDTLKQLVQKGLPAVGALYAGLAILWGFPHGEEVVGSLALLTTFGGVFLGISDRRYETSGAKYDGEFVVTGDPSQPHVLSFNVSPKLLEGQKQVTLKVDDSLTTGRS